jgi:hypothetical protein
MIDLKKILGAFVEIPDNDLKKGISAYQPPVQNSPPKPSSEELNYQNSPDIFRISGHTASQNMEAIVPSNLIEIEKRITKVLEEENKKNFSGADYYEFIIALENMKDVPVESARYLSAFNVLAATQGLTKNHLIETAQAYLKIIDREISEFNLGFEKESKNQVEDKQKSMEAKTNKMQELSQEISVLNEEIKKMNQELVINKNRLAVAKTSFISVANTQKEKISQVLNKIQSFIIN